MGQARTLPPEPDPGRTATGRSPQQYRLQPGEEHRDRRHQARRLDCAGPVARSPAPPRPPPAAAIPRSPSAGDHCAGAQASAKSEAWSGGQGARLWRVREAYAEDRAASPGRGPVSAQSTSSSPPADGDGRKTPGRCWRAWRCRQAWSSSRRRGDRGLPAHHAPPQGRRPGRPLHHLPAQARRGQGCHQGRPQHGVVGSPAHPRTSNEQRGRHETLGKAGLTPVQEARRAGTAHAGRGPDPASVANAGALAVAGSTCRLPVSPPRGAPEARPETGP